MAVTRRTLIAAAGAAALAAQRSKFAIRPDYLAEAEKIPEFWISSFDGVSRFLDSRISKGAPAEFGRSAGNRPMRVVSYGKPRQGKGTTTFSGSLGFGDVRAYLGPDHARKVYMAMAAVHGGEFEGIVGAVNLLSVLETGKDLRGKAWPELAAAAARLDRILIVPIVNVDGRSRVPLRMLRHWGTDHTAGEYLNTGGKPDGSLIGWPQCKQFIPLDFTKVQFPGGYPNDAGVNIQHDDFFGNPQPETRALLSLTARERPNLILNLHTGAQFIQPLRPFCEPALVPAYEQLYRRVRTRLTAEGLQRSDNAEIEADPKREGLGPFTLDSALNFHCGALSVLVESPSHYASTAKRNGQPFFHTPDQLVDAQLITHQESMKLLAETSLRPAR